MENEKKPDLPTQRIPEIIPQEPPAESAPTGELTAEEILNQEREREIDQILSDFKRENAPGLASPQPETPAQPSVHDTQIMDALDDLPAGPVSDGETSQLDYMPEIAIDIPQPEAEDVPAEEPEEEPVRKRRPGMKSGYGFFGIPHLITTVVWLALVVAIGVSLGRLVWVCASDVLAFGRENHTVVITISEKDTMEDITAKLKQAGLIRYPKLFQAYAKLAKVEEKEKISTGTFTLSTLYDYHALVSAMGSYSDARETVEVMIPPGYTCRQIFMLLEEEKVCSAEKLAQYAAEGELDDYWFLEGVTRGTENCLEGFLYPDTYQFYVDDEPRRVLEKLLDTFDYRFSDRMLKQIDDLNEHLAEMMADNGYDEAYIADNYYDIRKIITVASLIEKESANALESFTIASVFYNRLTNLGEYPFLNSDAALYYVLGGAGDHELTAADLQMDSPYNTYTHMGLIPGPIANPGPDSIYAALNPDDTDYHFFMYNKEEHAHHFSETLSEHEAYVASLEEDD